MATLHRILLIEDDQDIQIVARLALQDLEGFDAPDDPLSIPTTYTVQLDGRYIDPLTAEYVEGEITVPPVTGKILLIEPSI